MNVHNLALDVEADLVLDVIKMRLVVVVLVPGPAVWTICSSIVLILRNGGTMEGWNGV